MAVVSSTCWISWPGDYIRRGELQVVLPGWATAPQSFFAVYPPSRYVPKRVKLFVAFVANLLKQV